MDALTLGLDDIADERSARVALNFMVPSGHLPTGRLVQEHGALRTLRFALMQEPVPGMDCVAAQLWRGHFTDYDPGDIETRLAAAQRIGVRLITPGDPAWPASLSDLGPRMPLVLWARGAGIELLQRPASQRVGIVGSRVPSAAGIEQVNAIASDLARHGITIVSTETRGVDREAHSSSFGSEGHSIAVMTASADVSFRLARLRTLFYASQGGLVVTEVPPGAVPSFASVSGRARIIAALSGVSTMFEGGVNGVPAGTIREAFELGRGASAVPGPEDSIFHQGANHFIARFGATPVSSGTEVRHLLATGARPLSERAAGSRELSALSAFSGVERPHPGSPFPDRLRR